MKVRAIRASHGFQRRFWEMGQITELPDGSPVPPHFELVEGSVVEAVKPVLHEPIALSELVSKPIPRTGMMAGVPLPEEPKRRGRPKKT